MSFGGSANKSDSKSSASSFYDPKQTGIVDDYAQGVVTAANDPNSTLSYKPYTGPALSFGNPAALDAATSYSAPKVSAGQISATDLSGYMNPFQKSVIDATVNQAQHAQGITDANDAAAATAAHAFGGSRSAVLQNLDRDSMQRNLQGTIAGLNTQNFAQAQSAAGQDIASKLAADQGNQQTDLAAATQRLQAIGLSSEQAQQLFGTNWAQYINSQQTPEQIQALQTQAMGLVPANPLQKSDSSANSFGFSFQGGAK